MGATVQAPDGKNQVMEMGCYGIGITRIVGAAIEQNHDDHGIIWPTALAPFQLAICPINYHKSEPVRRATEKLYQQCLERDFEVLLDDRSLRPGVIFSDMELIGIPHRIVLSERGLAAQQFEYKGRKDDDARQLPLDELSAFLDTLYPNQCASG